MFSNYVKTALRSLVKNKYYSLISICSLGIAISCFIFTYAYYNHETNYDSYYKDNNRIYRITADTKIFEPVKLACSSELLTREIKKASTDFEYVGAVCPGGEVVVKKDDIMFREKYFYYAEHDFLNVFSTQFLIGNKDNALLRPQTVVLTQSIAQKYFGNSNPVGKEIMITGKNYEVTGVVSDPPTNTHLRYALLASYATIEPTLEYRDWTRYNNLTYIKLKPNTNIALLNASLYDIASDYMRGSKTYLHHILQPVSDIHTNTEMMWDIDPHTNKIYLYILLAVGILSLLMANINLINMSVSQSLNRAKEIGIRKVTGANKFSIIYQFFIESLMILILSSLLALLFSSLFIPVFNEITEINFAMSQMLQLNWLGLILLIVLAVSSISCIYPALVISSINPAQVLKKIFSSLSRGNRLKTALMTIQYTVTSVLLICFIVMLAQTKYMKNQYLGFDKERKLVLQLPKVKTDFTYLKQEFSGNKSITSASISSAAMGGGIAFGSIPLPGEKPDSPSRKRVLHLFADENFIRNYNIELLTGDKDRIFSGGLRNGLVVNEKFVQAFGWHNNQEAIGQTLYVPWLDKNVEVLGVVKNFHHAGLQSTIDPLLIYDNPQNYKYITLNIKGDEQESISFLKEKWVVIFPEAPFNYFFLDEYFNRNYSKDDKIVAAFSAFSWIGISIACFGLIGMTNYNIQRKIKEAGIRKVFGASFYNLLHVFINRIVLTILAAGVIASPIAYYLMDKWLSKYAYRIDISIFFFIVSILLIVIISLTMIIYPLYKAARKNPIESLRYE